MTGDGKEFWPSLARRGALSWMWRPKAACVISCHLLYLDANGGLSMWRSNGGFMWLRIGLVVGTK